MLATLPPEIIYLIATYLPTASALVHLAQTCRRLHQIITSEDLRIFQVFVKSRFPNVPTPPYWRDVAQALTSRSRALDKHAVIGRFVLRPQDAYEIGPHQATRNDNPTHGYRPAIDSYETWNGSTWSDRKEVVAWSAAHELLLRVSQFGSRKEQTLLVFNDREHVDSQDDIRGIHLLRPEHLGETHDREHLIVSRMRGDPVRLAISPKERGYEHMQSFKTHGLEIERSDLSDGTEPILATHFSNGKISFYRTTTEAPDVYPLMELQTGAGTAGRNRCTRFLSSGQFAIGGGQLEDAIFVWTISQGEMSLTREISANVLDLGNRNGVALQRIVTAITPIHTRAIVGSPGDAFLAAWGDGAVRLHDLRSDKPCEMTYRDSADQNPVYCIHPFGHDRFIVGAGGDAVIKIFDLRMPNRYSYREARAQSFSPNTHNSVLPTPRKKSFSPITHPSKEFSIFLSTPPPTPQSFRARSSRNRYRGPIYTMSSPSPLSPTIYTGIAGGVVRLDFTSTDDLTGLNSTWYRESLGLDLGGRRAKADPEIILDLSGYERPDSRDTTTCSKLRTQQPFRSVGSRDIANEQTTGWDRRWMPLEQPGAWRRQD